MGIFPPGFPTLSGLLTFGIQVLPAGYAWWILTASNRLFIGYYETLAAVGIFSVAYTFGYTIMNMIFGPIWLMYPPKAGGIVQPEQNGRVKNPLQLFHKSGTWAYDSGNSGFFTSRDPNICPFYFCRIFTGCPDCAIHCTGIYV